MKLINTTLNFHDFISCRQIISPSVFQGMLNILAFLPWTFGLAVNDGRPYSAV